MSAEDFNVFIYDIESDHGDGELPDLQRAMREAISLNPDERTISSPLGDYDCRLEHYSDSDGLCFLNFAILKFAGPGRAARNQAITAFNLGSDGRFAYQTAMLCDTREKVAFIQSSRPGMGPGAIAKYLNKFAAGGPLSPLPSPSSSLWFTPRLDPEARQRALGKKEIRSMSFRVGTRVGINTFAQSDPQSGLGYLTALATENDAGVMDLTLSFGPGKGSLSTRIIEVARRVLRAKNEGEDVRKLQIRGRDHEDEQLENINLLGHQEKYSQRLQVDSQARIIHYRNRWKALDNIRREFYLRR